MPRNPENHAKQILRNVNQFPTARVWRVVRVGMYPWPEVAAWLYKQGKLPQAQYEVAHAAL